MVVFTRSQRRKNTEREKRDEGVLEDVSNEEGENKKREKGEKEEKRIRRMVTRSYLLRPKVS